MDYKWQYKIRSKQLNKIMEKLEGKVRLDGYTLILPDDYEKYLTKEDVKGLSKKFYEYANNVFVSYKFEGDIKREEEQKRLQNALIEKDKESFNNWKDKQWIDENIGEYYNWEPQFQYYWTKIEDKYKVIDQEGNIRIKKDIYKEIENETYRGIRGSIFLGRSFKKNGKCVKIIGYYSETPSSYGVYGIYINDELFYVGSTMRDFEIRFNEHKENIKNGSRELKVYSMIPEASKVEFKKLFDCGKAVATDGKHGDKHKFTEGEIKSIEFGYIKLLQPKGNVAGRVREFIY